MEALVSADLTSSIIVTRHGSELFPGHICLHSRLGAAIGVPLSDVEKKVLAQHVFDALRDAWNIFEKTG